MNEKIFNGHNQLSPLMAEISAKLHQIGQTKIR
jgi:hypothetical protein